MGYATGTNASVGSGLTPLGRDELKRRIEAARILRGISQERLDALFHADGLGKSAGRLERGDKRLTLNRALLDGLVRHLRVPEAWFTSEDVDALVYRDGSPDTVPDRLSAIEEQLRLARAETATRAAEVLRRIDDRLPPSRQSQSQRPA